MIRSVIFSLTFLASMGIYGGVWGQVQVAEPNTDSAIKSVEIGTVRNVHQNGPLFLSGQFSQDDVSLLKKQAIERVITLRTDGEVKWDEKGAVEGAQMEFIEVPFRAPEALNDQVFDKIRELLKDDSKKTLLHCGSANRVGGVWLPYRVLDQGVELETALEEAKLIGLRTPFIIERAVDYIERHRSDSTKGGEKSVKPGINKTFIDPEVDVEAFVKRFEIESREVYLNRDAIVAACEIEAGDRVADVGAGTGLFTRMFSDAVGDKGWVYAVDISPRFLEHINAESNKLDVSNFTGVLCAENSVNLPPKSVDVVFVCDTYHHFEYPKSTLTSIHNALKDDGHLIVIDFERISGKSRDWLIGHVRAGKEVFRAEILDAGFTLSEEKKIEGFEENYFLKFRKN